MILAECAAGVGDADSGGVLIDERHAELPSISSFQEAQEANRRSLPSSDQETSWCIAQARVPSGRDSKHALQSKESFSSGKVPLDFGFQRWVFRDDPILS